nr:immunoglobulin heavy chain junction region [Mus musculus]MBK4184036.1 immunoglobulin heavy chain junction region [Mus musculus]
CARYKVYGSSYDFDYW